MDAVLALGGVDAGRLGLDRGGEVVALTIEYREVRIVHGHADIAFLRGGRGLDRTADVHRVIALTAHDADRGSLHFRLRCGRCRSDKAQVDADPAALRGRVGRDGAGVGDRDAVLAAAGVDARGARPDEGAGVAVREVDQAQLDIGVADFGRRVRRQGAAVGYVVPAGTAANAAGQGCG